MSIQTIEYDALNLFDNIAIYVITCHVS